MAGKVKPNPSNPLTIRRVGMIEDAIKEEALSAHDLAKAIKMCHQSTLDYIKMLLGNDPKRGEHIHIERWKKITPQVRAALYRWGAGKNARKPAAKSKAAIQRKYRGKIRRNPQANEEFLARSRERDRIKRVLAKPQNPFSALGL
jgi:hypothetical protein